MSLSIALEVNDKGSVVVRKFSRDTVNSVKKMTDKSIGHVKRLSAKFTKGLGGAVKMVGKGLLSLKTMAMGALAGWGITKVLTEFATFESALADMGKVTDESFDSIQKKIMKLPASLGSSTELVRGYYQVISAGVKGAANQINALTTASKLAKTAHAEQGTVIVGLSSVMDAFKTSSIGAADAMQTMEKTGKTTVGGLIPIIGEISSSSAALGISLDEMGAAFAAVTLQSGGTEKAATQYKAVMNSLIAPTKDMSLLLSKYGGIQEAIKQVGFGGVMRMIAQATGGNAEATKKLLGSTEAYLGFLSVSANQMQTYNQNLEEQKNKTGAVDKAWKDYKKTLNAIWETFKNTVGKQVILIGEKLAPTVKDMIEKTSTWLEKNRELITIKLSDWIQRGLEKIKYLVAKIKEWEKANDHIIKSIKAIISCVNFLIKAFVALGKNIGIVAAQIVGFFEKAYNKISAFVTKIKNLVAKPIKIVTEFIGKGSTAKPLSDKISEMLKLSTDYSAAINKQKTTAVTDFTGVGSGTGETSMSNAMQSIEDKWASTAASIENIVPALTIDTSPLITAIDSVEARVNSYISNIFKVMAKTVYSIQSINPGSPGAGFAQRAMKEDINAYQSMIDKRRITADIEIGLLRQYYGGTGLTSSDSSQTIHNNNNTKIGDIHLNIPASTNLQSAQDWRYIVREKIIPELRSVNYA